MMEYVENKYGEKIYPYIINYNFDSTDQEKFDRVINPFDLNITYNYPYEDEEKNNTSFLELCIDGFDREHYILVIFKYEYSAWDEYVNYLDARFDDDKAEDDFKYFAEDGNNLVLMCGNSIIILDIDTLNVVKYKYLDEINDDTMKIDIKDNMYVIKCERSIYYYDKELMFIKKEIQP